MQLVKGDKVRRSGDTNPVRIGTVVVAPKYLRRGWRSANQEVAVEPPMATVVWNDGTRCRIDGAKLEVVK